MFKILSVLVVVFSLVGCRTTFIPVPFPDKLPDATVLEAAVVTETVGTDAPVVESDFLQEFGDGTWIVGVDIEPWTYRTKGGENCYWERLSGFGSTFEEIIANESVTGQSVVTILPDDKGFTTRSCGTWTKLP